VKLLDTIRVPWTPYAVTFSRDGTRLAIGGGTYIGNGGIIIRRLDDGAEERLRWQDYVDNTTLFPDVRPYLDPTTGEKIRIDIQKQLAFHLRLASQAGATSREAMEAFVKQFGPQLRWSGIPTISSLAFSDDDRVLAASMLSYGFRGLPTAILDIDGTHLTLQALFTETDARNHVHTGVLFHRNDLIVRRHHRDGEPVEPFSFHASPLSATGRFDHLTHSRVIVRRGAAITAAIGRPPLHAGYRLAVHGIDGTTGDQVLRERVTAISSTPEDGFITGGRGEIDRWSWDGRWVAERIRPHESGGPSIEGIVTTMRGRLVAVHGAGELIVDAKKVWKIPATGRPRSLAAHPTLEMVAVGLKGGGSHDPASEVAILQVD
jgi:hypothetical protein